MPSTRFLAQSAFLRKTEDDPTGYTRLFRMGRFSYFDKPEGEGCVEKFVATNYTAFWATFPFVSLYYLGFKKIRTPLGFFFNYGKAVWPIHAVASVFPVASCWLCQYRGKDDAVNWGVAGTLAGAIPGLALRNFIIKRNPYGNRSWFFAVPIGMFYMGVAAAGIKKNNPRVFTELFEHLDEKNMYNPEKSLYLQESITMPGERISIDPFFGGFGKDMPVSWLGEKWEDRLNIIKRDYGYLEGELDQVPAIEKAIRERI